ncbi:uncharacterized protein [Aristolochia californica]|uniref:uncharacterized protein n=1 Tax=Aristolochia californica TaxID=171875 RepID=UPI0035E10526
MTHPYTASRVTQTFLEHIVRLHGILESIVSDRDVVLTSTFWKELFRVSGTKLRFSSAYHPQTDGQTKVVNRTIEMVLYGRDSPRLLSYARGSTRVDVIDQALMDRDQALQTIIDRLQRAQERMMSAYNKGHRDVSYEVAYQLQLPTTAKLHDVFHVSLPEPYKGSPPTSLPFLPPVNNGYVILTPSMVLRARLTDAKWEILV